MTSTLRGHPAATPSAATGHRGAGQDAATRDPQWVLPDRPIAVLVMMSGEDRSVMIDLSTHPCGQHIVDHYAAGSQLVSADHLTTEAPGTATDPARPV